MVSKVLQFFQLHVGLAQILLLALLRQYLPNLRIDPRYSVLAGSNCLLIDIQLEKPISCLLGHPLQLQTFLIVTESQRCSHRPRPRRPANSVDILGQLRWKLVVYHCPHLLDIEPPSCEVSSQKVLILILFEIHEGLDALGLTQISMQLACPKTKQAQNDSHAMALPLRLEEHDDPLFIKILQN